MAEILGLGVTHSPLLVGTDERMAGIFERVLNSPRLPPAASDPPVGRHRCNANGPGTRPVRPRPRIAVVRSMGSAPCARHWTRSTRISF